MRWTATNDSVRGGTSISDLSPVPNTSQARFHGVLDTKTLGGAGFASQIAIPLQAWDLSSYEGLQVEVVKGDDKKYTLILKDDVPEEKREDGRDKSAVNWQYDFVAGADKSMVWVPWSSFKPVYRGVEKPDAAPLKIGEIQRIALMFRRYVMLLI